MHILFTNNTLNFLSGTELYVYSLACEFKRRGHQVTCFSLKLGLVAEKIREAGITVTDDLSKISGIDIIHGHHPLESRIAAAFFPDVPVIFVCHSSRNELESPGKDNFIFTRFVAISDEVRQRLIERDNIPAARIEVVLNFVDLNRFTPTQACPPVPRRVVALSNHNTSTIESQVVRNACELAGLELRVVGMGATSVWEVEEHLDWADVVIAAARSALESMAMGRPTIIFKYTGGDGLVKPGNFDQLAATNFGGRTFRHLYTPEELAAEMTNYDLAEVAEVQRRIREERSLERAADHYMQIYQQATLEFRQSWPTPESTLRLKSVLKDLGSHLAIFKEADLWRGKADWGLLRYSELENQLRVRNNQLEDAVNDRKFLEADRQVLLEYNTDLQREIKVLQEYNASLKVFRDITQPEKELLQDQNSKLVAENRDLQAELSKSNAMLEQVRNGQEFRLVNGLSWSKEHLKRLVSRILSKRRA